VVSDSEPHRSRSMRFTTSWLTTSYTMITVQYDMTATIPSSTDSTFTTDVLQSDLPVLVDFWGEWCGPCKAMLPMLEQFALDYAGRVKVVKVEMDKNQKTAMAWRVRSAPTLVLFNRGAVQATQVGMVSKAQLAKIVDAAL
jgi:thioredoxin 1